MGSDILFILAGIILIVTLRNYLKRPAVSGEDSGKDSFKSAKDKTRNEGQSSQRGWEWLFQSSSERRRNYYRNEYLKSDAWKRKRFVVLRRDNWTCVYCGGRATQVHHKRYARRNIGKEPIDWLVSVCKPCHDRQHK